MTNLLKERKSKIIKKKEEKENALFSTTEGQLEFLW